jgi:hypothetical protein
MFKGTIIAIALSWPIHGYRMTWFTASEIKNIFSKPMNRSGTLEPLVFIMRANAELNTRGR